MDAKIISETKNPLLDRTEFVVEINSEANPTEKEVVDFLGKAEDLTIVRRLKGQFGKQQFTADVVVYDSKEAKDKTVIIPKKVRKKIAEDAKKAEEAKKKVDEEAKAKEEAEKKVEEAPVEEKLAEEPVVEEAKPTEEIKEEKKE